MKKRLTPGIKRGIVLMTVSFVLLACSLVLFRAAWLDFAKPPERTQTAAVLQSGDEVFVTPTDTAWQEKTNEDGETVLMEVEVPASKREGVYNILVVGTDEGGIRTDTIMIAHVDVNTGDTALLSIPRDTLITGNYAVPKINGVYGSAGGGEKGINALKVKLAQLLGFDVDGYAIVDLVAFVKLVDQVRGVEYEVPMDMDYDDPTQDLHIHLKAGKQHLDGNEAIQLVRFRSGYAQADIARTAVQQDFLKEMAKQCVDKLTIADIGVVAEIFKNHVSTDLSLGNIAYFGQVLLGCDFDDMFTYTLQGKSVMVNEASCWAIERDNTLWVVNEYFNPYDVAITAANVSIIAPEDVPPPPEKEEEEDSEEDEDSEETEEELPLEDDLFEEVEPSEEDSEQDPEQDPDQNEDDVNEEPSEEPLPTDDWVEEPPAEEPPQDDTFWPGR